MTPADKPEFLRVMNGMGAVFSSPLTPEALDVWWRSFGTWSFAQFSEAASAAVTRCKFMPRPADLHEIKRAALPSGGEAWEIAGRGIDERADRALSIATQGRYFGHIPYDEHPWIQKRFLEVYEDLADVYHSRSIAPQLAAPEWMGATNRLEAPSQRLLGEPKQEPVSGEQARQNIARLRQLLDS